VEACIEVAEEKEGCLLIRIKRERKYKPHGTAIMSYYSLFFVTLPSCLYV